MEKVIEVNLGIGMNMFFPDAVKIVIEVDDDQELKENYQTNIEDNKK